MGRNVEIKARARRWDEQLRLAQTCARLDRVLHQRDIFYSCPRGRLKLRIVQGEADGEHAAALIFYDRPDQPGPRISVFSVAPVTDPDTLDAVLTQAYGAVAVVRKRRICLAQGNMSSHFDAVEGLGRFIELEVALEAGQSADEGTTAVAALSRRLKIRPEDVVDGAYADLLRREVQPRP